MVFRHHHLILTLGIHLHIARSRTLHNPALAVLNLTKTYTERELEAACAYALERAPRPRCRFIKSILASGASKSGQDDERGGGGYIRGAGYYEEGGEL